MARLFASANKDNIVLGTPSALNITGQAITLSAWINLKSFQNCGFLGKWDNKNGAGGNSTFVYLLGAGGASNDQAIFTINGATFIATGATHLSLNTWYHLLGRAVPATNQYVFVNGVQDGTATIDTMVANTGVATIGCQANTGNATPTQGWMDGSIADAAIWNTNLSNGEIAALANGARPRDVRPGALVGYWPLAGVASPEPDLSSNANNGTVNGTTQAASGPPTMVFTPRWPQRWEIPTFLTLMPQIVT